jgi:capsular polysaccharide transport system ATP-binding protein
MIIFEGVTKVAGAGQAKRNLLTAVQALLPSDRRIAVFARNEQDKKLFIDLLAGLVLPSAGRIVRKAQLSFPPGYLGGFTRGLSVRVNVAHVARIYGAHVETVVDFVSQVSGLGKEFNKLYGDLPNLKKRYLSDILAFSIPFDVYLLGEDVVRPGSARYNKEARALFEARCKTSGMFIASGDAAFAREFCDMGLVLNDGNLRLFRNVERAIAFSEKAAEAPGGSREERRGARKRKRKRTKLAPHHSQK